MKKLKPSKLPEMIKSEIRFKADMATPLIMNKIAYVLMRQGATVIGIDPDHPILFETCPTLEGLEIKFINIKRKRK